MLIKDLKASVFYLQLLKILICLLTIWTFLKLVFFFSYAIAFYFHPITIT